MRFEVLLALTVILTVWEFVCGVVDNCLSDPPDGMAALKVMYSW